MQDKLLPNYSKKIAFPVGILCLFGLIFTGTMATSVQIDETVIEWILKDLLLISLLVLVWSREKEESPAIQMARYRELLSAVIFGVILVIYDSIAHEDPSEMRSSYQLMLMMLIYYLFLFFIRTKIKDPTRDSEG